MVYRPSHYEIENMGKRLSLTVPVTTIYHYGTGENDEVPRKLVEAVQWFSDLLEEIPAEHRETATLNIESDYESSSVTIDIKYKRPETDQEWADRKADVVCRVVAADQEAAALERTQYERLKAKFGDAA